MKYTVRFVSALFAVVMVAACAATPGKVSQTKSVESLNLRQGVALQGYDSVAYFAEGVPAVGDPAISYQWQGATWLFSTARAPGHVCRESGALRAPVWWVLRLRCLARHDRGR